MGFLDAIVVARYREWWGREGRAAPAVRLNDDSKSRDGLLSLEVWDLTVQAL